MADKKTFVAPFRRRKEGKTDYKKRLALVKSGKNRLVVRKSNRKTIVELVESKREGGDETRVFATSLQLADFGWKGGASSIPAAYLTGLLAGKKAVQAGLKIAVLDTGLHQAHHGGVIFAAAKGAMDAGLEMNVGKEALPSDARISGKHIEEFAQKLTDDERSKRFSTGIKNGFDPAKATVWFEKTKKMILDSK